ncbi:MAG: peptidylprolyl isomerase [Acidobacteria bacterium]|nr:peptidylprolyl isomerase [Acidobacteriota bacterium]
MFDAKSLFRLHQKVVGKRSALLLLLACAVLLLSAAQQKKRDTLPAKAEANAVTVAEAAQLEAVVTTTLGVFRFEFFADKAPRHVQQFIRLARSGYYDGSAFFRVIPRAMVQGGDPLLKNAATPKDRWGTGGLNLLAEEITDIKHVRGTVSTARIPGKAGSDGAQFFITLYPIPQYDGQFSAFGLVNEGLEVVEKISLAEADAQQRTLTPIKILSIKIEAKKIEPFKDATVDQLRREVLLRTTMGDISLEMDPAMAPEHVRNFLRLVETGWYNHTEFHRVIPGFVIQGGVGATRAGSPTHTADRWVHNLKPEFSKLPHTRGVLSMARGETEDSASTSFFIMLGTAPHLDNKYTIFGKVIDGFETLNKIEQAPRHGERPVERIELIEAVIKP